MKLYAPSYYKDFKCIADKCKHSCCVGWEIDIDSDTLQAYQTISHPYAETVRNSIDDGETPHFRLCGDERCPHLRGDGLCELILQLGEDSLCEICREHPRFYHETARGMEVGIGMSCEEACRVILGGDYRSFVLLEDTPAMQEDIPFDIHPLRERAYEILSSPCSYAKRIHALAAEFDITLAPDEQVRAALASLEYLDCAHKELFACYASDSVMPAACEREAERVLAYLIFRHCSPSWDETEFRIALRFCMTCERLLASAAQTTDASTLCSLARIFSEEIEYSEDNTQTLMEL